jgi:hypothetical protein
MYNQIRTLYIGRAGCGPQDVNIYSGVCVYDVYSTHLNRYYIIIYYFNYIITENGGCWREIEKERERERERERVCESESESEIVCISERTVNIIVFSVCSTVSTSNSSECKYNIIIIVS